MFNSLFSLAATEGAAVLDLFAGSGALGIEALSRGAAHATFVENDRRALSAIRTNLESLGFEGNATVVAGDALTHLARGEGWNLLFLDPPYGFDRWDELVALVHDAVVVIESDREIELPEAWITHRVRRYGGTVVILATAPAISETPAP